MPGLKGLWSLRSSEDGVYDKFLIQSFIGETRVLSIDEEEMGEVSRALNLFSIEIDHSLLSCYQNNDLIKGIY